MSIVNKGTELLITLPTWLWAVMALLLVLGVINMFARRGRY